MHLNASFFEQVQVVPAFIAGADQNADLTGDWVSLKNFQRCAIIFHKAAGTAGDDPSIRLQQATDVAGTGAKALTFNNIWHKIGATALSAIGVFTKIKITTPTDDLDLVSVNGVDLLTDVGESLIGVEIKSDELDVTNGFDCLNLLIEGDDVANANLCGAYYLLWGPRQAVPLSAIID